MMCKVRAAAIEGPGQVLPKKSTVRFNVGLTPKYKPEKSWEPKLIISRQVFLTEVQDG